MEVAFGIMNREWFDPRRFDFKLLKELLAIAIPLLPNFLIYWVFNSCDKVMITNMIGIGAAGIYSVGSKLGYRAQNNGGWLTHLSAGVVSQSESSSDHTSILKEKSKAG